MGTFRRVHISHMAVCFHLKVALAQLKVGP